MTRADALHRLADISSLLVRESDLAGVLARVVAEAAEATGATSAGLLVVNAQDHLELLSATSHRAADLEAWQAATGIGPCASCLSERRQVTAGADEALDRWPDFGERMAAAGYRHVLALPLLWQGHPLGGLNLFWAEPPAPDGEADVLGQLLADTLATAIVAVHPTPDHETRQRLEAALAGRVVIEQAKGVLAHTEELSMEEAFARLLALADERREPLGEVSRHVVESAHGRRST